MSVLPKLDADECKVTVEQLSTVWPKITGQGGQRWSQADTILVDDDFGKAVRVADHLCK